VVVRRGKVAGLGTQVVGATGAALVERKIKLSVVLDQGDDTEVMPLDPAKIRTLIAEWRELENDGEDPQEDEEATGDQLATLDFRLRQGSTPFVDFAVWRPFGARFGRLLKFSAFLPLPSGGFQTKEINGPACFEDWKKSWRVFVFGMVALKAASKSKLEKYELKITKLNETYPNMWWIIGMADIRMRSEHMERVRRKLAREHAAAMQSLPPGGTIPMTAFNPQVPWDAVFREAARDEPFWNENVDKKALMFATHLRTPSQLVDEGIGSVVEVPSSTAGGASRPKKRERSMSSSPAPRKVKKTKKTKKVAAKKAAEDAKGSGKGSKGSKSNDAKMSDGRFYRDSEGCQVCWIWNHSADGCSASCGAKRAHVCEWCRSAGHRSIACSKKPAGWTP
jgi:hypothetical protein